MPPQTQKLYEAAKAVSRLRFISHPFVVLREAITAFEQSQQVIEPTCENCRFSKPQNYHDQMWCRDCQQKNHFEQAQQEETKLDKLAENVLREYVKFKDVNGSKTVNLLPLTIVDAMVEFADRLYEVEKPKQEGNKQRMDIIRQVTGFSLSIIQDNDESYGYITFNDTLECMQLYASQQTASKDKEIAELKQRISELENK